MKNKHILFLSALSIAAASLVSCTLEPYELPKEELFTRAFIKIYGLIDQDQNWNTAERRSVRLSLTRPANLVKVYARVNGKYYLVSRYYNVSGDIKIPFDVPAGTTDLKVNADGNVSYAKVGESARITPGSGMSRGLPPSASSTQIAANGATYTVTATQADWAYFNAQQIAPITANYVWDDYWSIRTTGSGDDVDIEYTFRENPMSDYDRNLTSGDLLYGTDTRGYGMMPELDQGGNGITGNRGIMLGGEKKIAQHFKIEPNDGTYTIYPMYWNSSQTHTLGVYLLDNNGDAIKDAGGNILKFPVYVSKGTNDIQHYTKPDYTGRQISATTSKWSTFPAGFKTYLEGKRTAANSDFINKLQNLTNTFVMSEAELAEMTDWFKDWFNNSNAELGDDFLIYSGNIWNFPSGSNYKITEISSTPYYNVYMSFIFEPAEAEIPNGLVHDLGKWESISQAQVAYDTDIPMLMRSRGINIDLGGFTGDVGMYIEFGGTTLYSQSQYNPDNQASYAAYYQHPMSERKFFSFEDWTGGSGDADLNDLIFLTTNIKRAKGDINIPAYEDDDDVLTWWWAVEDLGSVDDFDFNDVVVKITSVTTNLTEGAIEGGTATEGVDSYSDVTFTAMAAGGILPIYLHYGSPEGHLLVPDGDTSGRNGEFHSWFGKGDIPHTQLINTGMGINATGKTCTLRIKNFTLENYASGAHDASNAGTGLYVTVNSYNSAVEIDGDRAGNTSEGKVYVVTHPDAGAAPQMFIIHAETWKWPSETQHIESAYPYFKEWVSNKQFLTPQGKQWYE